MVQRLRKGKVKRVKSGQAEFQDFVKESVRFNRVVSTGSTLLDLNISGGRISGGGLPGGILVEVYGMEGSGKTAVLAEICASAQARGGEANVQDPESRLDKEYSRIYGLNIKKNFIYKRPDTVKQMFGSLREWDVDKNYINVFGADSVSALSTEMEMEDEDKRGQKQAKEFSQNLRKHARKIGKRGILVIFTNQLREGERGETTSGGKALRYYASVRIRMHVDEILTRKVKLPSGVEIKKAYGIRSTCYIKKSTVDNPYRLCDVYILFGYGLDDVRANLQYLKDMNRTNMYECFGKSFKGAGQAIQYIEEHKLQKKLREKVIELWESIEESFKTKRDPKERW